MAEDEGGGGEPLPRDSDSSAEGGHEQRRSRLATGIHLAHCGDGECLEHSVPLERTRAMEKRNFPGFCLRAPAPTGEAVSSSFLPPAIFTGGTAAAAAWRLERSILCFRTWATLSIWAD
jgi:hypothetical protein